MKKLTFWAVALIAATLLSAFGIAQARADVFRLTINAASFYDGHEYVGPYQSTLTLDHGEGPDLSIPLQTFCVDFASTVGFGQPFEVSIISLQNYNGPLLQNYWEAGWLALRLQTTTDQTTASDIQRAMWLITTPGTSDPYLTTIGAFTWAEAAAQNFQDLPRGDVTLYLKNGSFGQSQLSVVPEPSAGVYAIIGIMALAGIRRWAYNRRA